MPNRIKAVREALKLSQREFGEKLGVSRDVISNLEYDRVQPKELLLRHICQLYRVNPYWLESGEGKCSTAILPTWQKLTKHCPFSKHYALNFKITLWIR